ncbi:predicted protein [Sclerotinia sclerotiorum 1980 UF-70]|uniref:Uncharacterized protein n=1 Tax=Sclerotinia sclerotiorum (strain ATCC 18683 / 1980 / Ss-1) TaxID=665079 RepID=A7ETR3_SCLS1|nr:predicted protein [Sclerotinia sclerotiorum 1980 UF-70]EDN92855.1 predicted protein [Sclerotinia sclerotiorum 1980 UF-70]
MNNLCGSYLRVAYNRDDYSWTSQVSGHRYNVAVLYLIITSHPAVGL